MENGAVERRVQRALKEFLRNDQYLLENDLGERCIAARLALHLQSFFPKYSVDVEYNRVGRLPKTLGVPDECANSLDENGEALVVPDIIVHRRGPAGPNILILEIKKTTNRQGPHCDRLRVVAFREQLQYEHGALIECETRHGYEPNIRVSEWFHDW